MDAIRFLSPNAEDFKDFNQTQTSCAILCEAGLHLLIVKANENSQAGRWRLPGGNIGADEAPIDAAMRIFQEQTNYQVSADQLSLKGKQFARISDVDSAIHFFTLQLDKKPAELKDYKWISIFALHILDHVTGEVVEGRKEAFDVVYSDRIWRRDISAPEKTQLIFRKEGQEISFDESRKLGIPFIGKPRSGKATQADWLAQALGMVSISESGIEQEAMNDTNAPLPLMLAAFDKEHQDKRYPNEVPVGMIGSRITLADCSAGFVLGGFQPTEEMCRFLTKTVFRENIDEMFPIAFDLSDEDVRKRFPEEGKESYEQRLTEFNGSQAHLKLFQERNLQTLALTSKDDYLPVFHQVALLVQQRFDALAQEQKAAKKGTGEPKEKAVVPSTASSSFSKRDFFVGSILTAAVIAGGFFYMKNKE